MAQMINVMEKHEIIYIYTINLLARCVHRSGGMDIHTYMRIELVVSSYLQTLARYNHHHDTTCHHTTPLLPSAVTSNAEHEPEPDQVNVSRTTQGKVRTHTNKRSDSGYIYIHVVMVSRCACVGCVRVSMDVCVTLSDRYMNVLFHIPQTVRPDVW